MQTLAHQASLLPQTPDHHHQSLILATWTLLPFRSILGQILIPWKAQFFMGKITYNQPFTFPNSFNKQPLHFQFLHMTVNAPLTISVKHLDWWSKDKYGPFDHLSCFFIKKPIEKDNIIIYVLLISVVQLGLSLMKVWMLITSYWWLTIWEIGLLKRALQRAGSNSDWLSQGWIDCGTANSVVHIWWKSNPNGAHLGLI